VLLPCRSEWKAAIEASAAAATKQLDGLQQKLSAEAAAASGREKALLQQAQEAAAKLAKEQVAAAKAELLRDLEAWGDKVKVAAGLEAAERLKVASEVSEGFIVCGGGRDGATAGLVKGRSNLLAAAKADLLQNLEAWGGKVTKTAGLKPTERLDVGSEVDWKLPGGGQGCTTIRHGMLTGDGSGQLTELLAEQEATAGLEKAEV
jgi:hypothetical protein